VIDAHLNIPSLGLGLVELWPQVLIVIALVTCAYF
jgi:hypothetical protein